MRTISLLCAVVVSVTVALAQTPAPKSLSPFEQELVNAENQLIQALQQKNVAYVNAAVSEDFSGIGDNGDFFAKDELVTTAQEGMPKDLRLYDIRVIQLTDNSAAVAYNIIVPGSRPRYRHMSDVWTKDGGKW